jgi:tetratricopeptide (TPR) repeat protein
MTDASKTVFISYRRSTSKHLARLIFERLRTAGFDVFFDVNTIDNGHFDSMILHQIAARPHFVLLLSPGTLERCTNEDDWLRREIEEAMRLQRNIVPVVEEGVDFSRETDYLPEHLRDEFRRYNALPLVHFYFDAAMDTLINRFLKQLVENVALTTLPSSEHQQAQERIAQAVESPLPTNNQLAAARLFNEGYRKQEAQEWDDAIHAYSEAIRLDPNSVEAFLQRGRVWISKGEYDSALTDFSNVLRLNPNHAYALFHRGEAYLFKDDFERAVVDFNDAERLNFKKAPLYHQRGAAYYHLGDWVKALENDQIVVRATPNLASSYINRGEVYFALKEYKKALDDFKKAAKLEPNSAHVLAGLAITFHALGNHREAVVWWKKLIPQDARYRSSAKWAGERLRWAPPLVEEARQLIARL